MYCSFNKNHLADAERRGNIFFYWKTPIIVTVPVLVYLNTGFSCSRYSTVPAIEIEPQKFTRSIFPSGWNPFKFLLVIGTCMLMIYRKFQENRLSGYERSANLVDLDLFL